MITEPFFWMFETYKKGLYNYKVPSDLATHQNYTWRIMIEIKVSHIYEVKQIKYEY